MDRSEADFILEHVRNIVGNELRIPVSKCLKKDCTSYSRSTAKPDTDYKASYVYSRDLLKDLIDVAENNSMEIAVWTHSKEVTERALLHLEHGVLDSDELVLDIRAVFRFVAKRGEDGPGFIVFALQNEPARAFGET